MSMRHTASTVLAAIALLLMACAPTPPSPPLPASTGPIAFPQAYYRQLLTDGKPVFSVDSARSIVVIEVRRGGSLAQFGHDHVVASHDVKGYIAPDDGRADFYVPLEALVVDEPDLRTRARFGPQPDAEDVAGTRHNMLQKVLNAREYPFASIGVDIPHTLDSTNPLKLTLTLHGVTRKVDATMNWERLGEKSAEEFTATGTFAIDQSDFGIAPFSVLGGAISVQDRLELRVDIRARRLR